MNNIHEFSMQMPASEPYEILNVSDVHWDSKNCDRKLLKKHFDRIKKNNGAIIINGDFLDVMGAKRDPRSLPNDIRPEYNKAGGSYLDLVIEDAYEFLVKYADNIKLIGYGNHETNIERRQQIDPLRYLVALINQKGADVKLGAYQGAIRWKFQKGKNGTVNIKNWYYHHGFGGNASRSKGILGADILVAQNSWADLITSGHDHQKWHLPYEVDSLNLVTSRWETRRIDILRTGSYKKKSRCKGWEVEKNFNQPTLGGYFVKYKWMRIEGTWKIKQSIEEAN